MQARREQDRQDILTMIDRYLAGEITADDLAGWATLRMSEEEQREKFSVEDYIVTDALGTMMMLSTSEPAEYRATRDDLLLARAFLLGEQPFPLERIPKQR